MKIVAMGGGPLAPLCEYMLELTGKERPRVCGLAQAQGDAPGVLFRQYELFAERAIVSHVSLFGIPRPDWREHLLAQDAIFVGGGNTANMLAVWRVHGVDAVLREAWERGIVLGGVSAGAICWFEAGVTDSFRAELDGIECLGWLPGSCCPHYDGEEARRPAVARLLAERFPPGIAIDDGVAAVYEGTELKDVVTAKAGSTAYRVDGDGEAALPATSLV